MPGTSGADLWAAPSKQHETQRGMVVRGHLMPKKRKINNSRMGKQRKTKKRTCPRWQCWRSPAEGAGKGAGCAGVRGVQLGETRCGQMNEGGELRRESRAGSWELENSGVSGTRDLRSWEGTGNPGRKRGTR